MEQHRTILYNGHTVHYRSEGSEHPQTLVLLHGFLQNLDVWTTYVLHYMHSMHVVTVDLPGHGQTDIFGPVHSMDLMADVVKAVLDELRVEQCVVAGHSMGGYVALALAERYPYLVRGVALINSHAMADNADMRARRHSVCDEVINHRESYILTSIPTLFDDSRRSSMTQEIRDLNDHCLHTSTESIIAAQLGMAERPSRIGWLQQTSTPILFILGRNDARIPVEMAVAQTLLPRYSESILLGQSAHISFLEERDFVRPRLQQFVSNCF